MSIAAKNLINVIEKLAPLSYAESWGDNSGLQLSPKQGEVDRILVALEVRDAVIAESESVGADFLVIHHPLIFFPIKRIDADTIDGRYVAALISEGIGVYAAHISFDAAPGGMNDMLAAQFALAEVQPFPASKDGQASIGRAGRLECPQSFKTLCARAEDCFGMAGRLKTVGNPDRLIERVAVCGGAGGEYVEAAIKEGIDLYITSDVRHHEAHWAKEDGLCLIDGGHWGTEKIFVPVMAAHLRKAVGNAVEIIESKISADPWM